MSLLHDEGGFTITELLVAMVVGIIVLFAAFQVVDSSVAYPQKIQNRVDAYQRGRLSMDIVSAQLRSQVCLAGTTPPIIPTTSTATDVWFYNNTGDQNAQPQMRHIYLSAGSLIMQTYQGVAPVSPSVTPTFPGTPTTTRTLLTNVGLVGTTPLFQYFAFDANQPANVDTAALPVPISVANSARVVDLDISYRVHPTGASTDNRVDSIFQQSVYFRTADPTDPAKGPKCQ